MGTPIASVGVHWCLCIFLPRQDSLPSDRPSIRTILAGYLILVLVEFPGLSSIFFFFNVFKISFFLHFQ